MIRLTSGKSLKTTSHERVSMIFKINLMNSSIIVSDNVIISLGEILFNLFEVYYKSFAK